MESDLEQQQQHQHRSTLLGRQQQQAPQQMNSGLTRYRSAPSSYFTNIIDKEFYEDMFNRPSSPETERVFSGFMNSLAGDADDSPSQYLSPVRQNSAVKEEINQQPQLMSSINNEPVALQQQNNNIDATFASAPHNLYQSVGRPPLPNQSLTSSGMEGAYSMGVHRLPHIKSADGNNSNLIRHNSSPAGLFSHINIETGYAALRGTGMLGAGNSTSEEANFSPARRLKNPPKYSTGLMSSIAEIGDRSNRGNNPDSESFGESHGNEFITGFPAGPWDDSAVMSDNIAGLKRFRDEDAKTFSETQTQNETGTTQPRPSPLAHHMSLPKTSAEMAAIEKFLQFSDSIPCKIRAKRGCATHPRSIAERVRRTKISERMRKLQDLVPNMDKQTNTSDMLDLAVDYIKDLQKQVQTLSDSHAKCTCSHKQQQ